MFKNYATRYPPYIKALKAKTFVFGKLFGHIYCDLTNDLNKSLVIAGTGRAGKTWLSNLINYNLHYRFVFEPIQHSNDKTIKRYCGQYIRPDEQDQILKTWLGNVLQGTFSTGHLNRKNNYFFCQGKMLMDDSMSLLLKWFRVNFPEIPIIFISRDPRSVVSSWIKTDWARPKNPDYWLNQQELVEDFLDDFEDLIRKAETDVQKFAVQWCILNYIPLKQLLPHEWMFITYEQLVLEPRETLERIFSYLNVKFNEKTLLKVRNPSHTAEDNILAPEMMIGKWKKTLTKSEIRDIEFYVEQFGLQKLVAPCSLVTSD